MNRCFKHLLVLFAAALLCALLTVAVFAVPAKPGTHTGSDALCRSHTGALVTLDSLENSVPSGRGAKAPVQPTTQASLPLLVLVLGFNNIDYSPDYNWSSTIFEGEKSLAAYYTDMSFGKFTVVPAEETSAFEIDGNTNLADAENDGVVHLKMDVDHKNWTLDNYFATCEMDRAFIQAVNLADAYVDFASYDKNGDGVVSNNELALAFVVAGYEASETSSRIEGKDLYLWAHSWTLEDAAEEAGGGAQAPRPDGVLVSPYITIAESLGNGGGQAPISVLAHELGHFLGLPDLYDTGSITAGAWNSYDVSSLSVMANGSWGEDEDGNYCPFSMDVWSRSVLGWCEPAVADVGDYSVCAQIYDAENETFAAVKIPTPRDDEYYLLENRQNIKWDVCLSDFVSPTSESTGIIVWHIDMAQYALYQEDNEVNNGNHHPAVMPLYPEGASGCYTFLGSEKKVDSKQPFFDKTQWETAFTNLGPSLDLPLYGAGDDSDKREARLASGILVTFLDNSNPEMHVHVDTPLHVHNLAFVERAVEDCKAGGTKAHWLCFGCNRSFADENGLTELTAEELAIPPADHVWDAGRVFAEPNYDDEGLKCFTCTVCGKVRYEPLPVLVRPVNG